MENRNLHKIKNDEIFGFGLGFGLVVAFCFVFVCYVGFFCFSWFWFWQGGGGVVVLFVVLNRRLIISCQNRQHKRVLRVFGCYAVSSFQTLHNYFTLVFISLNHDIIVYRREFTGTNQIYCLNCSESRYDKSWFWTKEIQPSHRMCKETILLLAVSGILLSLLNI